MIIIIITDLFSPVVTIIACFGVVTKVIFVSVRGRLPEVNHDVKIRFWAMTPFSFTLHGSDLFFWPHQSQRNASWRCIPVRRRWWAPATARTTQEHWFDCACGIRKRKWELFVFWRRTGGRTGIHLNTHREEERLYLLRRLLRNRLAGHGFLSWVNTRRMQVRTAPPI